MTLSTSATDKRSSALKTALIYSIITAFIALFGAVYEIFSHGVYTYYMLYAFAFPLVLGTVPYIAIALSGVKNYATAASSVLYHFGVATLTIGSIIRGILVIYGTTNALVIAYPIVGDILLIAPVVLRLTHKNDSEE